MSPTITIRIAQSRDAENIAKLCHQLGYPTSTEALQQRFQTIQANDHHIIYVALVNEAIVGWVHSHLCDLVMTPPQIVILGLVVDEQHRGCGIGRLLLQHIEQWAEEKGCDTILVRSNIVRTEAHLFYQKIGYKTMKQSKVFVKSLNEPIMLSRPQ
jgi:GNAT superfamily N-acetyltransferase